MGQICSAGAMDLFPECLDTLCGSRKYPCPHHGGNWKFQRGGGGGGGVKGPGNSGEEGGLSVNLHFQMVTFDAMQICFKIVSYLL